MTDGEHPTHIARGTSGVTFCGRRTHTAVPVMPYAKWIGLRDQPPTCEDCLRAIRADLADPQRAVWNPTA